MNGATFKATNYINIISFISLKSGQVLTVEQLTNKYNYWKTYQRKQETYIKACFSQGRYEVTSLLYINEPRVINGYFNQYIKRRAFKKKYLPHFKQLKELLKGKIASGEHAALINNALDENSAQNNQKDDNISLSNADAERKKENKDTKYLNALL